MLFRSVKSKNPKMKSVALPSALSACMGITEPAIFGVNLRYGKPFIAASIGGACGALYASIVGLGATGTGVTGIFGILLHLHNPLNYVITMVIAFGTAFVLTGVLGFEEETEQSTEAKVVEGKSETEKVKTETDGQQMETELSGKRAEFFSPIPGEVIALSEIPDETFASGVLGDGVGVKPSEGKVYAPFDGTVSTVFDTKHAIGLTAEDGTELLIHVGIETVTLKGKPFRVHVESGQKIKKGALLIEFDIDKITEAGLSTVSAVIVTDSTENKMIEFTARI